MIFHAEYLTLLCTKVLARRWKINNLFEYYSIEKLLRNKKCSEWLKNFRKLPF